MATYEELSQWYKELSARIPKLNELDRAKTFQELVQGKSGNAPCEVIDAAGSLERAILLLVREYNTPMPRSC